MYLVDTSVWIDYLRGREVAHVQFLDALLANPLAVGISDLIYLEILQGATDAQAFEKLKQYFSGQRFYRFTEPQTSHANAAKLYFDARRAGITVRSTLDCLIAQCAIDHNLILLHNDADFVRLGEVNQKLTQRYFLPPHKVNLPRDP